MGAGRKTESITLSEKVPHTPGANCSAPARNLQKKDLAAVIFGCTHHTMDECLSNNLFGLPAMHFSYIKNIDPGLPLFLFNYSDRKLYGIYEAASHGRMNIDPFRWTYNGCDRTQYPAQVRIRVRKLYQPLFEEQYGPIIHKNYINEERKVHFRFELDHKQTHHLIAQFECSPVASSFEASYKVSMHKAPQRVVSNVDKLPGKKASREHINRELGLQYNIPDSTGNWASLFKANTEQIAGYEVEAIRPTDSEAKWDENDLVGLNLSNVDSALSEEKQMLKIHSSKVTTQDDEDRIYSKLTRLAFVRDSHSSNLEARVEDLVFCDTGKATPEDTEENGYTDLLQSTFDHVYSNMVEHTEDVPRGMESMCLIDQLRKELEEWKGISMEQQRKASSLDKKLIILETYSVEQQRRTSALEKKLDAIERGQATLKKPTEVNGN